MDHNQVGIDFPKAPHKGKTLQHRAEPQDKEKQDIHLVTLHRSFTATTQQFGQSFCSRLISKEQSGLGLFSSG